jgi:hypothetical protein
MRRPAPSPQAAAQPSLETRSYRQRSALRGARRGLKPPSFLVDVGARHVPGAFEALLEAALRSRRGRSVDRPVGDPEVESAGPTRPSRTMQEWTNTQRSARPIPATRSGSVDPIVAMAGADLGFKKASRSLQIAESKFPEHLEIGPSARGRCTSPTVSLGDSSPRRVCSWKTRPQGCFSPVGSATGRWTLRRDEQLDPSVASRRHLGEPLDPRHVTLPRGTAASGTDGAAAFARGRPG